MDRLIATSSEGGEHGLTGFPTGGSEIPDLRLGQAVELGLSDGEGTSGTRWFLGRLESHDRHDAHIVVSWPAEASPAQRPRPGQALVLAVSAAGSNYAVDMMVETTVTEERISVVLHPRGAWRRLQRRQAVRLPVSIRPLAGERLAAESGSRGWQPLSGLVIENISVGGALVRTRSEIQADDRLRVILGPPAMAAELTLAMEVLRVEYIRHGALRIFEAGCRFYGLTPADQAELDRLLRERQARGEAQVGSG